MATNEWKKEYNIGHSEIDRGRKQLFELTNELGTAIASGQSQQAVGKVLTGIVTYIKEGLTAEELALQKNGYHGFDDHKAEHERFRQQAALYLKMIKANKEIQPFEIHNWLKTVVSTHILTSDKKYEDKIEKIELL